MSTLPVAARPAATLPRVPFGLVLLGLALAVMLGAVVGAKVIASPSQAVIANNPTSADSAARHAPVTQAAAAASTMDGYRLIVANIAAAEKRHDFAAQHQFVEELDRALTPAVIGGIYIERAELVASLETAVENHDSHGRAVISRQLAKLCGPAPVKARVDFCN
ncbi:MAG: hypothetical protein ACJ765_06175 [Chloroflexota bacterium]